MANFLKYAQVLARLERYGVYTNDPLDAGGSTMSGITLKTFQGFYGRNCTVTDLKAMNQLQWRHIIKTGYWDRLYGDEIKNQSIAEISVDWAVNSGLGIRRNIQRILQVPADGVFGTQTIRAINSVDQSLLFIQIKNARRRYFEAIILRNPSQRRFEKGWMNRLNAFTFSL